MEYLGNDSCINDKELSLFLQNEFFNNKEELNIDSWEEGLDLEENCYWNMVIDKLSKIEKCEKIIKTKDKYDDVILFVSQDTSSRYVSSVMDVYTEILCSDDKYFNLLVLNNDEYDSWETNENNITYWENVI